MNKIASFGVLFQAVFDKMPFGFNTKGFFCAKKQLYEKLLKKRIKIFLLPILI